MHLTDKLSQQTTKFKYIQHVHSKQRKEKKEFENGFQLLMWIAETTGQTIAAEMGAEEGLYWFLHVHYEGFVSIELGDNPYEIPAEYVEDLMPVILAYGVEDWQLVWEEVAESYIAFYGIEFEEDSDDESNQESSGESNSDATDTMEVEEEEEDSKPAAIPGAAAAPSNTTMSDANLLPEHVPNVAAAARLPTNSTDVPADDGTGTFVFMDPDNGAVRVIHPTGEGFEWATKE